MGFVSSLESDHERLKYDKTSKLMDMITEFILRTMPYPYNMWMWTLKYTSSQFNDEKHQVLFVSSTSDDTTRNRLCNLLGEIVLKLMSHSNFSFNCTFFICTIYTIQNKFIISKEISCLRRAIYDIDQAKLRSTTEFHQGSLKRF